MAMLPGWKAVQKAALKPVMMLLVEKTAPKRGYLKNAEGPGAASCHWQQQNWWQ